MGMVLVTSYLEGFNEDNCTQCAICVWKREMLASGRILRDPDDPDLVHVPPELEAELTALLRTTGTPVEPPRRAKPPARQARCWCGSQRRYQRCHGRRRRRRGA